MTPAMTLVPSDDRVSFARDSKTKPRFQIAADPYKRLIMLRSTSGTVPLQTLSFTRIASWPQLRCC